MKRLLLLTAFSALFALLTPLAAQTRIDQMVDNFSSVGDCTFTSIVQRDPKTRRVEKVVRTLTVRSNRSTSVVATFRAAQAELDTYLETVDGGKHTVVGTLERPREARVYMLQYPDDRHYIDRAEVTIIVRYKPINNNR